jgi:hypothetical protein
MRFRPTASVVGLLCLVVAGCTTVSPGEAMPTPTSEVGTTDQAPPSSSDNEDLPSHGAPKVESPLENTSRFEQDPCLTLTAEQLRELDVSAVGEQEEVPLGIGCNWRNPETRGQVTIAFLPDDRRGLSASYAANEDGKYAYLEPLPPIEGYPAIAVDIVDRRPRGICIVEIGVTDQLVFDVVLYLSQANVGQKDPCDWATRVAGMALRTMQEGA